MGKRGKVGCTWIGGMEREGGERKGLVDIEDSPSGSATETK